MGQTDIMCCAGKEHHLCSIPAKNVDAESGQEETIGQIQIKRHSAGQPTCTL